MSDFGIGAPAQDTDSLSPLSASVLTAYVFAAGVLMVIFAAGAALAIAG